MEQLGHELAPINYLLRKIYLFEMQSYRERKRQKKEDSSSSGSLPRWLKGLEPGKTVAAPQAFRPSFIALPGAIARTGSGAAR